MSLSEKQAHFASMVGQLLRFIDRCPTLRVTFGEAYRPPELAELYSKQGRGIKRSLHTQRLAIDLNLFELREGKWRYVSDGADPIWSVLGRFWESIGGSWGGRFRDSNHFSLEHGGVR